MYGLNKDEGEGDGESGKEINAYLTDEERKRLLASLHHVLVWVGVREPEELKMDPLALKLEMEKFHQAKEDLPPEVHADSGIVELHSLIWRLVNEKEITETEKILIEELIDLLEKKEREEEESLRENHLTSDEARHLYGETAGVIRALLDLKELLKKKEHSEEKMDQIQRKVNDARRWNDFVDNVKKGKAG